MLKIICCVYEFTKYNHEFTVTLTLHLGLFLLRILKAARRLEGYAERVYPYLIVDTSWLKLALAAWRCIHTLGMG